MAILFSRARIPLSPFIVAALFLGIVAPAHSEDSGSRNVICLIDYSSSLKPATLDIYAKSISEDIFTNLGGHDVLQVLPIDEGSKTHSSTIVYEDMSDHFKRDRKDGIVGAEKKIQKRADIWIASETPKIRAEILRQRDERKQFSNHTDLFSVLEQSASHFKHTEEEEAKAKAWRILNGGEPPVQWDNVIVIFSDMIHESQAYNFDKGSGPDEKQTGKILADLSSRKRLPDLKGVKVYVIGSTGRNTEQVENIQRFWAKYFKQTGADLLHYDYEASKDMAHEFRAGRHVQ